MKGSVASFFLFVVTDCKGKGSKWKRWDHTVHLEKKVELKKCRRDVTKSSNALNQKGIIPRAHQYVVFFTTIVIMVFTVKLGCKCC